jgi:hypothetical protein
MIPPQVGEPKPMSEEQKDYYSGGGHRYNLDDAFVHIDGKRYNVVDLLRLVVEKLTPENE